MNELTKDLMALVAGIALCVLAVTEKWNPVGAVGIGLLTGMQAVFLAAEYRDITRRRAGTLYDDT